MEDNMFEVTAAVCALVGIPSVVVFICGLLMMRDKLTAMSARIAAPCSLVYAFNLYSTHRDQEGVVVFATVGLILLTVSIIITRRVQKQDFDNAMDAAVADRPYEIVGTNIHNKPLATVINIRRR